MIDDTETRTSCPDDGACHHECASTCWRVANAGPLSAARYPNDDWPDEVKRAHGVEVLPTPPADDVRETLAAIVKQVSQKFAGPSLAEFANDPPLRKHYATADAIVAAFDVRPRGTVTEDERSAINAALIRGLPLWVSAMEEGHARKALLDGIVEALEAAREVQP